MGIDGYGITRDAVARQLPALLLARRPGIKIRVRKDIRVRKPRLIAPMATSVDGSDEDNDDATSPTPDCGHTPPGLEVRAYGRDPSISVEWHPSTHTTSRWAHRSLRRRRRRLSTSRNNQVHHRRRRQLRRPALRRRPSPRRSCS